jgi:hypothetical protein
VTITVRVEECPDCKGKRRVPKPKRTDDRETIRCGYCRGAGRITYTRI